MTTNIELLREIQSDPLKAAAIAQPLMLGLGVDVEMAEDPAQYIVQVTMTNPRYVDSKGDKRSLQRREVQERAHIMTDDSLVESVMNTATHLGLRIPKYPFDVFADNADVILVTSGAAPAIPDRTNFAVDEGPNIPIFIAGGSKKIKPADKDYLQAQGFDPDVHITEADMAVTFASSYDDERIQPFIPRIKNPDNLDVIREFVLTNPVSDGARLLIVTTGIYVAFVTADAEAVEIEFGNTFDTRVYAGESPISKIEARTVDTYRSEIGKTLISNARKVQAQQRRIR